MQQVKKKQKYSKKKKRRLKIIKWTSIIILILVAITLFLLSDVFNIKEIEVINNSKIPAQEIIELSGLQTNENRFKFLKIAVEEKIRQDPYIDMVKIKRKLDGTVEIEVIERVTTYMLILENQYAYINNQGYILEITDAKLEVPTITGYTSENLEAGHRLVVEDLRKLDTVIQIVKTAEEKSLDKKITNIDITDDKDFLITMESENKLIHMGNSSNINDKFINIDAVLKDTEGQKGEIFVKDINKVFFREDFR